MIKPKIQITSETPAVFIQYGKYLGRSKRTESKFQVVYGVSRERIALEIQSLLDRLVAEVEAQAVPEQPEQPKAPASVV